MHSHNSTSVVVVLLLVAIGLYLFTLLYKPGLIPPVLRLGSLNQPTTVLLLGVDVVYTDLGRRRKLINQQAFNGRSDTIMVARLDPLRNSLHLLSIPRDTLVQIPGYGTQKINSANAIGGAYLAKTAVSEFLGIPIDHCLVLNVHGLVELVNELGGITVEVPKRMRYMDWTAKLKIDLEPGPHTLTGNQAMGFVRFRHDALGDIGRVQRQQIFIRAVLQKAMQPESWSHVPKLLEIARNYINTDMSSSDIMEIVTFARGVPKPNQSMVMLPGTFSGTGDWSVDKRDVRRIAATLLGSSFITTDRPQIRVSIVNASSHVGLGNKLARLLRRKGYSWVAVKPASEPGAAIVKNTSIIAQRANPEDAEQVRADLSNLGDVVTASVGDIESSVTVIVGDDLQSLFSSSK